MDLGWADHRRRDRASAVERGTTRQRAVSGGGDRGAATGANRHAESSRRAERSIGGVSAHVREAPCGPCAGSVLPDPTTTRPRTPAACTFLWMGRNEAGTDDHFGGRGRAFPLDRPAGRGTGVPLRVSHTPECWGAAPAEASGTAHARSCMAASGRPPVVPHLCACGTRTAASVETARRGWPVEFVSGRLPFTKSAQIRVVIQTHTVC